MEFVENIARAGDNKQFGVCLLIWVSTEITQGYFYSPQNKRFTE